MADIQYYVDDYIEQGYYVYTAEAVIGLGDYLEENYLTDGYYQRTGTYFSLTAELVRATYIEGAATFSCAFTQSSDSLRIRGFAVTMTSASTMTTEVTHFVGVSSALTSSCTVSVTAGVDRRTTVTLSTLADLNAQAARTRDLASAFSSTFTHSTSATKTTNILLDLAVESQQTTTALRTAPASADLTASATQSTTAVKTATVTPAFDSIASQLTVAYKNATGTILMEPRATLTAVIGVIKQFSTPLIRGAQFNSDSDWLVYTDNTTLPYGLGKGQIISFWMRKEHTDNFGYIWNSYGNRSFGYPYTHLYYVDKTITYSSYTLTAPNSFVGFDFDDIIIDDNDWHHYAIVIRTWSGAFPGNFVATAYRDGQQISSDSRTGPSTYGHYANWYVDNRIGFESRIALAQLWIGPLYSSSSTPSDLQVLALLENFYDSGYVDLGTGVVNGFTPGVYELFDLPNTDHVASNGADISVFYSDYPLQGISGRFVLDAQSVSVLENTVYAEASATLTATATRTQLGQASLTSTATLVCDAVKTAIFASAVSSTASLSADYIRYRDFDSALSASTTQTTDNQRVRYSQATLAGQSTLSADVGEITQVEAQLTATATQNITYTRVRYNSSTLSSEAALAFDPEDRLRDQSAALSAEATLTADGINLEGTRVTFTATASLTCDAEKRIVASANLSSAFTQITVGIKAVNGEAHLPAIATQLSVVDIINFDPFLTIVVPAETRTIRVKYESRLFVVEQETRHIRVRSETRELIVPESTQTKLTQGSPL